MCALEDVKSKMFDVRKLESWRTHELWEVHVKGETAVEKARCMPLSLPKWPQ